MRGARLVYVTPSHQFPLGVAMSLGRRLALVDWAEEHDSVNVYPAPPRRADVVFSVSCNYRAVSPGRSPR